MTTTVTVISAQEERALNRMGAIIALQKSLDIEYDALAASLKKSKKYNFADAECTYVTRQGTVLEITERLGAEIPITVDVAKKVLEENRKKSLFSSIIKIDLKLLRAVVGDAALKKVVKRKPTIFVWTFSKK